MAFLASGEFCCAGDFALYLKCCPEILGGRALEGASVMALGSPCPLTLLYAITVLCSQDQLGSFWLSDSGLLPLLHNLNDASTTAQPQIELLQAALRDRLVVVQAWKMATLQSWAEGSHPKSWTWGFSTAALHQFLFPGFLFVCLSPNTACGDYV